MTPHADLKALLDAYVAVTGIAVSLSFKRQYDLGQLVERGMTAQDVTDVLQKLKRLVARGTHGYTDASLDFRNALGNPDTFEERALKLRQENFRRKASQPKAQIAVVRGDCTVLDEQPANEPIQMSKSLVRETLKRIADGI